MRNRCKINYFILSYIFFNVFGIVVNNVESRKIPLCFGIKDVTLDELKSNMITFFDTMQWFTYNINSEPPLTYENFKNEVQTKKNFFLIMNIDIKCNQQEFSEGFKNLIKKSIPVLDIYVERIKVCKNLMLDKQIMKSLMIFISEELFDLIKIPEELEKRFVDIAVEFAKCRTSEYKKVLKSLGDEYYSGDICAENELLSQLIGKGTLDSNLMENLLLSREKSDGENKYNSSESERYEKLGSEKVGPSELNEDFNNLKRNGEHNYQKTDEQNEKNDNEKNVNLIELNERALEIYLDNKLHEKHSEADHHLEKIEIEHDAPVNPIGITAVNK